MMKKMYKSFMVIASILINTTVFGQSLDEKIFLSSSTTEANPEDPRATFFFDYEIKQLFNTPSFNGIYTYYINSKDGTIAYDGEFINAMMRSLGVESESDADQRINFAIKKANREIHLYVTHKKYGRVIFITESATLAAGIIGDDINSIKKIFENQDPSITPAIYGPSGEKKDYRSLRTHLDFDDGYHTMDLFFEKKASRIVTDLPFLGAHGVGVMKDYKERKNLLLVRTQILNCGSGGRSCVYELADIKPVSKNFSGKDYKPFRAGGEVNTAIATTIQEATNQMIEIGTQIMNLEEEKRECPKGKKGKECREKLNDQIKKLEIRINEIQCQIARATGKLEITGDCH